MNDHLPAGWYHGAGDPPGTQRWWDGEMWVGDAVPAPVPQAMPGGQPGAYGAPPAPAPFAEKSEAVTALVLGILAFLCCQLTSPFAWIIGQRELDAIEAGRRDPSNQSVAMAGKVLGIIGSVLLLLGAVVLIGAVIISSVGAVSA